MWANVLIVAGLVLVVILALRAGRKHFLGQGGCCGGGDEIRLKKKGLQGPVIERKLLHIEGMTCDRCRIRVENELNEIEGLRARVDLGRKTASLEMTRHVPEEDLRAALDHIHYRLTRIEDR